MEVAQLFQSERGLQLSSVQWLLDHHWAKLQERQRMVDDFDLQAGDTVLDLGCGPGLWTAMFAEKVGLKGKVVGVDFSPELIDYGCECLRASPLEDTADFALADFYAVPFADASFDVVFFGNCCAYVTDVPALFQEHRRVTKPGGRVIAKEFDGGAVIFHPMDPHLLLKVLEGAARRLVEDPSEPYFDNFVGRKMHGNFKAAGFHDVSTTTYAIQKVATLNEETKRYVMENGEWYERLTAHYLSDKDARRWSAAFEPASPSCILEREDFYFCMVELVTVGVG